MLLDPCIGYCDNCHRADRLSNRKQTPNAPQYVILDTPHPCGTSLDIFAAYAGSKPPASLRGLLLAMAGRAPNRESAMTVRERIDFAVAEHIGEAFAIRAEEDQIFQALRRSLLRTPVDDLKLPIDPDVEIIRVSFGPGPSDVASIASDLNVKFGLA